MTQYETPFLVNVTGEFSDYISSLAKTGKKNYRYVEKNNSDLTYGIIPYDSGLVSFFMNLWEDQLIRGQKRKWGFGEDHVRRLNEAGYLDLFACYTEDRTVLSIHFVERYQNYVYCHPPLYDKETSNERYIAKYMWFELIRYYMDDKKVEWIDFGAGDRGTWKDLILNREKYMEKMAYKWLYVPKIIKENPESQKDYIVEKSINGRKLILR